jgi:mannose-6-phosphate isomerase
MVTERGADRSLADCIAADPLSALGSRAASAFGPKLPFLLKVLAAEEPLSLQAHPSMAQAEAGFDREEALGVPLTAPHRNYKDRSHKPELLAAVTPFEALYGFRRPSATRALFARLSVPALGPLLAPLDSPENGGLSAVFVSFLSLEKDRAAEIARAIAAACDREARLGGPFAAEYVWGTRIAELHPGDIGIAVALLLNLVRLAPGQAIYLPAGNLHAYLQGVGIELMASSDNVLRGGLTKKHVDVPELARVVRFESDSPRVLTPSAGEYEHVYPTPAPEFRLSSLCLGAPDRAATVIDHHSPTWVTPERNGPEILLCWAGRVEIDDGTGHREILEQGGSIFICGSAGRYTVRGEGLLYRATVGEETAVIAHKV